MKEQTSKAQQHFKDATPTQPEKAKDSVKKDAQEYIDSLPKTAKPKRELVFTDWAMI